MTGRGGTGFFFCHRRRGDRDGEQRINGLSGSNEALEVIRRDAGPRPPSAVVAHAPPERERHVPAVGQPEQLRLGAVPRRSKTIVPVQDLPAPRKTRSLSHVRMVVMNKATWAMLNDSEKELLRSAERASLARLDEDALVDLHARVRRARQKYTTLYRRRASSQVQKDRNRAKAHAQHARTAAKAEAFEDALARVSRALAKAARASAVALRSERLEAASRRSESSPGRPGGKPRPRPAGGGRKGVTHQRTPISERARASARARTRRVQAARDAR